MSPERSCGSSRGQGPHRRASVRTGYRADDRDREPLQPANPRHHPIRHDSCLFHRVIQLSRPLTCFDSACGSRVRSGTGRSMRPRSRSAAPCASSGNSRGGHGFRGDHHPASSVPTTGSVDRYLRRIEDHPRTHSTPEPQHRVALDVRSDRLVMELNEGESGPLQDVIR